MKRRAAVTLSIPYVHPIEDHTFMVLWISLGANSFSQWRAFLTERVAHPPAQASSVHNLYFLKLNLLYVIPVR
jgi:hypothetical protein